MEEYDKEYSDDSNTHVFWKPVAGKISNGQSIAAAFISKKYNITLDQLDEIIKQTHPELTI
jgi:hypothetical protein